jgi:hypothetical protein
MSMLTARSGASDLATCSAIRDSYRRGPY